MLKWQFYHLEFMPVYEQIPDQIRTFTFIFGDVHPFSHSERYQIIDYINHQINYFSSKSSDAPFIQ